MSRLTKEARHRVQRYDDRSTTARDVERLCEEIELWEQKTVFTRAERKAWNALAEAANAMFEMIGPDAPNDAGEITDKIHQLQSMVLSQVGARCVPGARPMGSGTW